MSGVTVAGRMLRSPRVSVNAHTSHVEIRIDDTLNPETWTTVSVSARALASMLGMILVQRPNCPASLVSALDSVTDSVSDG